MKPHFIVHEQEDTVGVVVVSLIKDGEQVSGWVMETDETVTVKANSDLPLGHKLSLREISYGSTIIKYGHDIGKAVADISIGDHVHVHNVKTKRW